MDLTGVHKRDTIQFKRIRPRFRFEVSENAEEINLSIRSILNTQNCHCTGTSTSGFANFSPPKDELHFWSPQLTITIEETEKGSIVRGLYGLQPSVWTMFVFFYAATGFSLMISLIIGLSYWSLNIASPFTWLSPLLVLLFMSIYLVAYFGQKLGHRQMTSLHRFAEQCFEREIPLS